MCIRDRVTYYDISLFNPAVIVGLFVGNAAVFYFSAMTISACLLYTSDAADDLLCVDLGGRRIIKKKKLPITTASTTHTHTTPFVLTTHSSNTQ